MGKPLAIVDWGRVLCHDLHWRSLPPEEFSRVQQHFFTDHLYLVEDWMRGMYTAEHMNQNVALLLDRGYEEVWDVFVRDCQTMTVSLHALIRLAALRDTHTVVLLTDNMDSFTRFTAPTLQLAIYFDGIGNSHEEKLLKCDNGGELFRRFAERYDAPLADSVLFDDSEKTCELFRKLGGTAYQVTLAHDLVYHLKHRRA